MQKKFIALAVAGLVSGAAFAQSNVTVYGVADATFDVVSAGSSTYALDALGNVVNNAGGNLGNMTRISSNSSYLGFKGVESLGNGLNAVFQLEGGLNVDGSGSGTFGFGRDTFVGLSGGFGTVVLGTLTGPTRALGASLDVFSGATGIGANTALLGKLGNAATFGVDGNNNANTAAGCGRSSVCTSLFDTRWKNAVAYVSPNLGGVTLTGAYVANENKSQDNIAAANKVNTKGYDVGAVYKNGPIMAGLTYNHVSIGDDLNTKAKDLRLGGSYDFGVASLRLVFDQTKLNADGGLELKQNVWGIGGTFNVTAAGKIVGQYYQAGDVKTNLGTADQTGAKLFALGYEHSLSKRTLLKATYSRLANSNNAGYDFGIGATGVNGSNGINDAGTYGATLSGFQVGVRHSF